MKSIIAIVPAACLWKFLFSGYIEKLMGIFVKWTLMVHFTVRPFVKAEIKSETQPQLLILYDIYLENKYQLKKNVWDTGGFPGGSEDKASACNAGDPGSIPGLGRSPGEGNGNPLQYSCLENPMDRGAWRATVHGVAKSRTRLSNFTFTFTSSKPHLPNSVHEKYVTGKGKL